MITTEVTSFVSDQYQEALRMQASLAWEPRGGRPLLGLGRSELHTRPSTDQWSYFTHLVSPSPPAAAPWVPSQHPTPPASESLACSPPQMYNSHWCRWSPGRGYCGGADQLAHSPQTAADGLWLCHSECLLSIRVKKDLILYHLDHNA